MTFYENNRTECRGTLLRVSSRFDLAVTSAVVKLDRPALNDAPMIEDELNVPECLVRVRRGDEDAVRAMMRHLHPLVMKIIRSHRPRRVEEEDLAQMIYTKVFTRIDQYEGLMPFEHWVSRVAVNTCLSVLRAESIRPEWRMADLGEEEQAVVENLAATTGELDASDQASARELVEKLLQTLKPEDRLVVRSLHMEGRSVAEVQQMTGWSAALVKVRAFRARLKLRKSLERLLKERTP
jgi:RNA polymerase sigma factor (sigma-70 family)